MIPKTKDQICQACGTASSKIHLPKVFSYRTNGEWGMCNNCKSYILLNPDDQNSEIEYLQTRPWGDTSKADKLISFKNNLYTSIIAKSIEIKPPPSTLLDVGCCYGGLIELARSKGYEVCGYDIINEAVEKVRNMGIECYQAASAKEFVSKSNKNSFDMITCVDVHYYWQNQRKELKTLIDLMKKDGFFILRARTMNWLVKLGLYLSYIAPKSGSWLTKKALRDYQFSMSANQLIKLIEECGGKIVYASPSGAMPSKKSSKKVKLYFTVSSLFWNLFRKDISIGFLIIFKRA